jgi:hypothetical protein
MTIWVVYCSVIQSAHGIALPPCSAQPTNPARGHAFLPTPHPHNTTTLHFAYQFSAPHAFFSPPPLFQHSRFHHLHKNHPSTMFDQNQYLHFLNPCPQVFHTLPALPLHSSDRAQGRNMRGALVTPSAAFCYIRTMAPLYFGKLLKDIYNGNIQKHHYGPIENVGTCDCSIAC